MFVSRIPPLRKQWVSLQIRYLSLTAIVISNNLIKKVDGTKVVYVLKNGEKTAVEVETGLSTGSQTEIKSGLKEGDEIVIR